VAGSAPEAKRQLIHPKRRVRSQPARAVERLDEIAAYRQFHSQAEAPVGYVQQELGLVAHLECDWAPTEIRRGVGQREAETKLIEGAFPCAS
jgi:hypothetical protein